MAQPIPIVADPISSDGSEESWILLDEMDEAMREEDRNTDPTLNVSKNVENATESSDVSAEEITLSSPEIEMIDENDGGTGIEDNHDLAVPADEEPSVDYPSNVETMSSCEALSACPSNNDDDGVDEIQDTENLRSVLETNSGLQACDESNDGSTTDGSISIIGERERNQNHREEEIVQDQPVTLSKPQPKTTTTPRTTAPTAAAASASAPQPSQMWLRCTPIDMSHYSKRPIKFRPYDPRRCQPPLSVEELAGEGRDIHVPIVRALERLNNFLSGVYLFQVFLLFVTACSVAVLASLYSRYTACKLEIKDLEQKLYSIKADKYELEGNLARCEYLYEMEKAAKPAVFKAPTNEGFESAQILAPTLSYIQSKTGEQNFDSKPEIQPTRRQSEDEQFGGGGEKMQTVWTGADDNLVATEKPRHNTKDKHFDCTDNDDGSLFSEYNREYCENQKKNQNSDAAPSIDQSASGKVYATHYSYKPIDDGECNPNKIDFTLGIEHAEKIFRETNCDDDGTLKYLQKAYENFEANTKINDQKHIKKPKQRKIRKYDDEDNYRSQARFIRKREEIHREEMKLRRIKNENDDKENHNRQRKGDRKDDKDKDRNATKRIKNDRKSDMVKVDEHRHDQHHE